MIKNLFLYFSLLLLSTICFSQTDVRAWYADGQVFILWKTALPIEETYSVFANPSPFTNTAGAMLLGRPFSYEYLGYGLKDNLNEPSATFRIPDGQGGVYQVSQNEGLFVFTPHQPGSLYFAVSRMGNNLVVAGQNITDSAVAFRYDPLRDPVECHLQRVFPSPFTAGYVCLAYCLWSDGRQNHWEGRPDFPIMANAAKNGTPGLFLLSAPADLDTTKSFPLSIWLHGGGGIARQSLAGSRQEVGINPEQGILIAHDDKMYGYRGPVGPHPDQPTWHFGYGKQYDPFSLNNSLVGDTIINYTQRRYLWIDRWLAKQFKIDTNRINIHGHSMGSAGALAMVKCFPEHYGSATLFNTGCAGPEVNSNTIYIFGTQTDNFPTNLTNRSRKPVRFYDLWDLFTNCSPSRDLPLIRHWHGKNDDNGTMRWSPIVVANFKTCDSLGTGIQNFWSERPHGMDMAPAFNDHWIRGIPSIQQTASDNVDFAEARYRSNESFPAFFNHRKDPENHNPGTGLIGINLGDGDNWGTWGGYHRWENVTETAQSWAVIAWLESKAVFLNDQCPEEGLTSDLAIRRPKIFLPETGQTILWKSEDLSTGNPLQSGMATVGADGLVFIRDVNVFKESIRKVRIALTYGTTSVINSTLQEKSLKIFPNPSRGILNVNLDWQFARIIDLHGVERKNFRNGHASLQTFDVSELPVGLYLLETFTNHGICGIARFIKH